MEKVVSIIIPCYNAEAWLAQTIDSCLAQTYPHVEIIVVDDCSTDDSPQILQGYGNQIRWVRQPHNQGGNAARNRGYRLATGDYIQWLDADDLLRPRKLERQVQFLEANAYDGVYGDWQARYHYPDGRSRLSRVMEPGVPADVLEALLADWWTAVASLLFRRDIVERSPCWNEQLRNADDRYYVISLAMAGGRLGYQAGCESIYRRYSGSISVASPIRWIRSHQTVLGYALDTLQATGRLTAAYRQAIATSYFKLSRHALRLDKALHQQLLGQCLALVPDYRLTNEAAVYRLVQQTMGFYRTEQLVAHYRLMRRKEWVGDEW